MIHVLWSCTMIGAVIIVLCVLNGVLQRVCHGRSAARPQLRSGRATGSPEGGLR